MAARFRSVSRRGVRAIHRVGGAASETFVIDRMLTAGLASISLVRYAGCISHRLYSAYTGPLIRVRRASDNAEADIAYVAATGRLDTVALAAHCGASNGFLVKPYDQSTNGNDFTGSSQAAQPKVYDGTTGVLLIGSLPVTEGGSNFRTARSDVLGFASSPAITTIAGARFPGGAIRGLFRIGANPGWSMGALANNTVFCSGVPFAASKSFTTVNACTTYCGYIGQIPAGSPQNYNNCTMRQDGTSLSMASQAGGTIAIAGAVSEMFGALGGESGGTNITHLIHINDVIAGAVLAEAESFNATLKALSV